MYNLDDLNSYSNIEDEEINKEDMQIAEEESNIALN